MKGLHWKKNHILDFLTKHQKIYKLFRTFGNQRKEIGLLLKKYVWSWDREKHIDKKITFFNVFRNLQMKANNYR